MAALSLAPIDSYSENHHSQHVKMNWNTYAPLVIDAIPFAIMVTDAHATIVAENPAFCRITGYASEEVIGNNPRMFQSGRQSVAFYEKMWLSIHTTGCWCGEIWNKNKTGSVYPEWLTIQAIYDADGQIQHYISSFEDISKRKAYEKQLKHLANHDALTGLPNRLLFMDRLQHALKRMQRCVSGCGVIYIDIDGFKPVNDTHGHAMGDALLCQIAQRLKTCVRNSDTVARMGGDEFVLLVDDVHHSDDIYAVAQKVLISISTVFALDTHHIKVGASIGISHLAAFEHDENILDVATHLLKQADTSMYAAKQKGRNRIIAFNKALA